MDATGRLTYRLANRDKNGRFPLRFPATETRPVAFPLCPFMAAICCALLRLKFTPKNRGFSLTRRLILCLIGRDKWKVEKPGEVGQRLPGDHFHLRKQRSSSGRPTQVAPDLDQVSRALRQQAGLILCMCSKLPWSHFACNSMSRKKLISKI